MNKISQIYNNVIAPGALAAAAVLTQGCETVSPAPIEKSPSRSIEQKVMHADISETENAHSVKPPVPTKLSLEIPGLEQYTTTSPEFKKILQNAVALGSKAVALKESANPFPQMSYNVRKSVVETFTKASSAVNVASYYASTQQELEALSVVAQEIDKKTSTGPNEKLNFKLHLDGSTYFQGNESMQDIFFTGSYELGDRYSAILQGEVSGLKLDQNSPYSSSENKDFADQYNTLVDSIDQLDEMQKNLFQYPYGSERFDAINADISGNVREVTRTIGKLFYDCMYRRYKGTDIVDGREGAELAKLIARLEYGDGNRHKLSIPGEGSIFFIFDPSSGRETSFTIKHYLSSGFSRVAESWNMLMAQYYDVLIKPND